MTADNKISLVRCNLRTGEILDADGQVIGRVVPVTDGDNANDRGARVLREVYSLCEDTQDKCAIPDANDFNRGRAFEAKGIARAMGAWYQAEFCGQSFMGEPVIAPPADERVKVLEAELARVREERDALRAAWECAKRQNAHDMLLSGDEIHQHDAAIQQARGAK